MISICQKLLDKTLLDIIDALSNSVPNENNPNSLKSLFITKQDDFLLHRVLETLKRTNYPPFNTHFAKIDKIKNLVLFFAKFALPQTPRPRTSTPTVTPASRRRPRSQVAAIVIVELAEPGRRSGLLCGRRDAPACISRRNPGFSFLRGWLSALSPALFDSIGTILFISGRRF